MFWLVATASLIILALPFLLGRHFRHQTFRLQQAEHVWSRVEQSARVLLEDESLDSKAVDIVETLLKYVGSGMLTRAAIFVMLRKPNPNRSPLHLSIEGGQATQFSRFVVSALLFDSYHTKISGIIIRRWLYWLPPSVADKRAVVTAPQISPVVEAADRVWHRTHPGQCATA